MVTESPRATAATVDELATHIDTLRADAERMDGYARRLLATAATLDGCSVTPEWGRPALERQAAACTSAAEQLRGAADALTAHAGVGHPPVTGARQGPAAHRVTGGRRAKR
ncbi:hypothetical protein [Streptomyces sp. NPDC051452]|uniref:hypothetical protein n=1 Tax=Streptomyces sp. NPDC051452 TaxID=3365654 RepID=UPI0037B0C440